ncbi:MAG: LLM class flavin-dependent oxidoreductase [Actinomycetota bacterium]
MRLGIALPHYDTSLSGRDVSWDGIRRAAQTAESCGLDSVWVSDHLFLDWARYGGPDTPQGAFECWTTLTAVAAVTRRVRIGSLTLCNDLRNPALLAKMAGSLDLLSGGRLDVGMGAGWYEPEFRAAGIPFDRAGVRIERLGEAAEIVARLLSGEVLDFEGRHYTLRGALCRPLPAQSPRPPVWLGGKGDRLLATAARVADGWNFSWIGSFGTYRERLDVARRVCEDAGRDPATLRRSAGVYVLAGRDEADARRRFERLAERSPPGVLWAASGERGVSWDEFRRARVAGSSGEVIDKLGRLADLGVEEAILSLGALPFQVADLEDVELVGAEIAPALR